MRRIVPALLNMGWRSLLAFSNIQFYKEHADYFSPSTELKAGCLLFIGFQKRARIQHVLDRLPPLLVIAAMVAVMFRPVAGRGGTVSIVVLAVILMACLKKGTVAYRFLTLKASLPDS